MGLRLRFTDQDWGRIERDWSAWWAQPDKCSLPQQTNDLFRAMEAVARDTAFSAGPLSGWMTMTPESLGLEQELQHELELQLAKAERDALEQLRGELAAMRAAVASAAERSQLAYRQWRRDCAGYGAAKASRQRFVAENPIWSQVPVIGAREQLAEIDRIVGRWAQACSSAHTAFRKAQADVTEAQRLPRAHLENIAAAKEVILSPLTDLIAAKKSAVESAEKEVARTMQSIQRVFLQAFGILVLVTLAPVGIKAVWYWLLAPIVERRPPIRIRMGSPQGPAPDGEPSRRRISAVSQDIACSRLEPSP